MSNIIRRRHQTVERIARRNKKDENKVFLSFFLGVVGEGGVWLQRAVASTDQDLDKHGC